MKLIHKLIIIQIIEVIFNKIMVLDLLKITEFTAMKVRALENI